jgi:hypothetical protein
MSVKSLKRHEGWLLLDHTASPGIPADIARKIGLDPKHVAEGKKFESATITCKHCGSAYLKNPKRTRPRGYCRSCDHYICDPCAANMTLPGYIHRCKEMLVDAALTAGAHGKIFDPTVPEPIKIIVP